MAWEDARAALEQTGGTEGTAIASTGTGAGGAVGVGWDVHGVCQESEKSERGVRKGEEGWSKQEKSRKMSYIKSLAGVKSYIS